MTNMIPSWLRLRDGGFEIVEPRARIIRWIYDLAIDGLGNRQILRKLESDKVPAFTRSKKWGLPYLSHILKSRTVLGELQPMERKKRALKPDGDPIPNYYPAIIDERTWLLARAAREERQKHRGRHGEYVNPFAGLLRDAVHGGPFYANNNGNGKWIKRYLINYEGNQGREKITTFPFGIFERCILERLREVPASALLAQPGSADEIAALSAERAEKENRLRAIQDALRESGKPVKSLAVVAEELEDEIADLGRLIEEATNRADLSDAQVWGDATTLMGILESGTEEEKREKRLRLRAILRRTIHSIYIVVASLEGKSDRVCIAQAFFVNSKKYRAYVIWYKRGSRMRPEERSECMDFPHKARHLDLRSRAQAAELQREFAASPSPFA